LVKRRKNTRSELNARIAIGAVLGFYRRIQKISQHKLATKAGLTQSSVAMFESGKRLPSVAVIARLGKVLDLNRFQQRQLEILAASPLAAVAAGHEWFLAEDVLHGTPLFLRDLARESKFQISANIREMWVVTRKPLASSGEMFNVLRERLSACETKFIYFIDASAGEAPIHALWSKLRAEPAQREMSISSNLKFVLTPGSFCLYHFAICNPGEGFEEMFGRSIVYAAGVPVGFTGMDAFQVARAYELLSPICQQCLMNPGKRIATAYGDFRLVEPEQVTNRANL
jgi:transcriptional regulator with XRE-family HTH domain